MAGGEELPAGGNIVVVCQTSGEDTPCHDELTKLQVNKWESSHCPRCQGGGRAIHVDPQSYELVPKIEYTGVKVNKGVATANSDFWTMANEADAVELHKVIAYPGREPSGTRHFSVLLDMQKLAEHDRFRERCRAELRNIDEPNIILIPEHPSRIVVEELCREVHPRAQYLSIPSGPLTDDFIPHLRTADRILVADDAVVSGRRSRPAERLVPSHEIARRRSGRMRVCDDL